MTTKGYFSAVAHHDDPDLLVVRSRVLADAELLAEWCEAEGAERPEVVAYQTSDYPWRVILPRSLWASFVAAEAEDIDYTNFKNAVTARQGHARHDVYAKVWGVLLGLEDMVGALTGHAERAIPHPKRGDWRLPSVDGQMSLGDP